MKEKDIEESKKDEVFKEGLEYKIFLKNRYVFTGTLLGENERFIKIFDEKTQEKVLIPITDINNIIEVKQ